MTVTVAVVYHSGYGHTAKQAAAVLQGIESADATKGILISIDQNDPPWETLNGVDGIIFGAPTYMGSVSAPFKGFMEATSSKIWTQRKWKDKVAAGFTNSGSRSGDKLGSLIQMAIFAAQHGMHWVNLGLMPGHNRSDTTEDTLNRHGFFLGAAAQSDVDKGPNDAPSAADLKTAEHLGARVATVVQQLSRGRMHKA